ncbi:MAG: RNA polymerase sigma factor [Sandaracinaceae bacterium]
MRNPGKAATHAEDDRRVRAAVAGDRKAAEAILMRLLPTIRNLSRYLVRTDAEAEDAAQVACVEILKSLHGWRGEASLEAWALRIVARVARRHQGKVMREHARRSAAATELRAVRESPKTPDRYLERRDMVQLLDALPESQRQALVLHHVLGWSVPEIAAELEVPFDTAKSRLRLGRKKLRALYLAGDDDDDTA